jgi:hypothetical protein
MCAMPEGPIAFQFGEFRTLPLYVAGFRTLESGAPLQKVKAQIEYHEPDYEPPPLRRTPEGLSAANQDWRFAFDVVRRWNPHISSFLYYVQFKDDSSRRLARALHDHTDFVSTISDSRLGIDPASLWRAFDLALSFECVHSDYRADQNRDAKWSEYASRLRTAHKELSDYWALARRATQRMSTQIELKATTWRQLPELAMTANIRPNAPLLFYSYSHIDEELRDQLETHLALLKRQGLIAEWHDRRITAGREWKGEIDSGVTRIPLCRGAPI